MNKVFFYVLALSPHSQIIPDFIQTYSFSPGCHLIIQEFFFSVSLIGNREKHPNSPIRAPGNRDWFTDAGY